MKVTKSKLRRIIRRTLLENNSERDAMMRAEDEYIRQQMIRDQAASDPASTGHAPIVNDMIEVLRGWYQSRGMSNDTWNMFGYEEEKQFEEDETNFLNMEFPDASSDEKATASEIVFNEICL